MTAARIIADLFRKVWGVQYDYGGAMVITEHLWLPRALWYRFVHQRALPGRGYTATLTRGRRL